MKTTLASLSKKSKNPRSAFFSSLMKELAGDTGNDIAQSFVDKDAEAFKSKMDKVVGNIVQQIQDKK